MHTAQGTGHESASPPPRRPWRTALVCGGLAVLLAFAGCAVWLGTFVTSITGEQMEWRPRSPGRLSVRRIAYARQGIVLDVHAPAGVVQVWRQHHRSALARPTRGPHHYRLPFRILQTNTRAEVRLLVGYEFHPGREWLLAIKSSDGYWTHMSPGFPGVPDVSDEEWEKLVARAQLVPVDE